MAKEMLSKAEWGRNVGTESYPVTFLHEYAVALLYDMLGKPGGGDRVDLPTMDGGVAEDVMAGVDRVAIPDALQPVAGYIPDIALYDKDLRVVKVIEVVVTSAPQQKKIDDLTKRGVEIIVVPVRNEDELRALFPRDFKFFKGKTPTFAFHLRPSDGQSHPFSARGSQSTANKAIDELIRGLLWCTPEKRRELVEVLDRFESLDSLYPLRFDNPKRDALMGE